MCNGKKRMKVKNVLWATIWTPRACSGTLNYVKKVNGENPDSRVQTDINNVISVNSDLYL